MKIAHASISEKGTINGSKGDQTKKEVCIRTYYTHASGWIAYEPKEESVGKKIAYAMTEIANNDNFGYGQNDRLSGYEELAKVGFDPKKVKVKCNLDCSEAIRCALAYAGYKVGDFNTATEQMRLENTKAFKKITGITDSKAKKLKLGTILVTPKKGHTCAIVEVDQEEKPVKVVKKKSNEEIAKEVIAGKWGNNPSRKKKLTDAGYDYAAIQKIVNKKVKK